MAVRYLLVAMVVAGQHSFGLTHGSNQFQDRKDFESFEIESNITFITTFLVRLL